MDGWTTGWTTGWMDHWMDGPLDGWTAGRMDRWMDGPLDGWMDGWMNDRMNKCILVMPITMLAVVVVAIIIIIILLLLTTTALLTITTALIVFSFLIPLFPDAAHDHNRCPCCLQRETKGRQARKARTVGWTGLGSRIESPVLESRALSSNREPCPLIESPVL